MCHRQYPFAGANPLAALSEEQRTILADAARETQAFAATIAVEDAGPFCEAGGRVVAASEADVAALERAARPVYDTLEADPQTEAFIEQIRDLKNGSTAAEPAVSCASS